jgi:predicted transposase/invertase (TIGR01784 family)
MAYDLLTSISQDADERARFRARRKFQMDLQHNLIVSREEGKLDGKLEDARNMLAGGIPMEAVVKITGLSPDKIQRLVN